MQGDEGFDAIFERCSTQIYAYALRRVGGSHEAEDIVAESFAVAWRRREDLPSDPLPWLYGVAANVISNQRRSDRRRTRLRGKLAGQPVVAGPDHAEAIADQDAFSTAFSELSGDRQEVLRLVAWEGLQNSEAAVVLGCSETAFKVRLHRARRDLAKRIERAGHWPVEMSQPIHEQIAKEPK